MMMETEFGEMQMVHILEEIYKDIDPEAFKARIELIDGLLERYIGGLKKRVNSTDYKDPVVNKIIVGSLIRSKIRREESDEGFNRVLYFIFNNDTHNVEDIVDIYDVNIATDTAGKDSYTLVVKEQE